ncbi:hypothetical protein [Bifidobacterium tibiigranuli]|jgi:hypothetical protein|uniref:hypothetical protein n=1 Tax=Bifidobacterium tibiigranuli TaxID=2172043 RepID=UPI002354500E|nr:hypothetical protein [Bifidobacterium tibiigranuli]MCH3975055.1 hypothetical protein [Bifidobacterium tibiigranuli]MCH4202815.1 hypothetical protein [Bifidobacterium tibiigranuli]MCH4274933.1 hypothetical protein [Bifidobacterium tibiigranuli]MCI1211020.1 hypothetical protein [Bifidobacterium tibiigranuli]MCI1221785.1 hypothetical protein [Bifidobacterium tibiigranuli]
MSGEKEHVPIDWSDQDIRDYVIACRLGRSQELEPVSAEGMTDAQKQHEYYQRWYAKHRAELLEKRKRKRKGKR